MSDWLLALPTLGKLWLAYAAGAVSLLGLSVALEG